MSLPVAILAGGLAKRMRPLTESTPKSLLIVAGRPFIEHQLRLLSKNGLRRAVLCLGFLGEKILEVVGNGSRFGLEAQYSFDGPDLLGTAGSLRKALPLLDREFFVLYGDSYLDIDYQRVGDAFLESGKKGLMTVFKNDGKWDKSNILYRDGCVLKYSKKAATPEMRHIDYGLCVLSASALEALPEGKPADLAEVLGEMAERGEIAAFEADRRFYEIGSVEGLRATERYILDREE